MTSSVGNRRELVREVGERSISPLAVVAGALVAFGAVALVAAVAGAVGSQLGLRAEGISTAEWRRAGTAGAVSACIVLFLAFLFGGYTAGRMAARAGAAHGFLVFLLTAVVVGATSVVAATWGDPGQVADQLRDTGVPTDGATWSDIGLVAGIAAALAVLVGALIGGREGARWHVLLDRAGTALAERRSASRPRRLWRLRPTPATGDASQDGDAPHDGGDDEIDLRGGRTAAEDARVSSGVQRLP